MGHILKYGQAGDRLAVEGNYISKGSMERTGWPTSDR